MIIVKFFISIFPLLFWGKDPVLIQAKTDFEKANQHFMVSQYAVQMSYAYYKQAQNTKPDEIKTGVYYKQGSNTYSLIDGIESIRTANMCIAVQKEENVLVVSNAYKINNPLNIGVDSILTFCSSINRTEPIGNTVKYELLFAENTNMEFEKIEVFIDKKTGIINKLFLFYPKTEIPKDENPDETEWITPKLEISFKNYSKTVSINSALFSENTYVIKTAPNKYKGAGKYSSYTVYNQKYK